MKLSLVWIFCYVIVVHSLAVAMCCFYLWNYHCVCALFNKRRGYRWSSVSSMPRVKTGISLGSLSVLNIRLSQVVGELCGIGCYMFWLAAIISGSDCERLMKKQHIFDYYISHSNQASALQFLMSMVPSLEDPTPCPPYALSLLAALPHTTEHVHNMILDEMAR